MTAEAPGAVVLVHVAGRPFALPVASVGEVLRGEPVTAVPRAAPPVAGLANHRWRIVTVLDPRMWLGLPQVPVPEEACIVVLASESPPVGLLVDDADALAPAVPIPGRRDAVLVEGTEVPLLHVTTTLRAGPTRPFEAGGAP